MRTKFKIGDKVVWGIAPEYGIGEVLCLSPCGKNYKVNFQDYEDDTISDLHWIYISISDDTLKKYEGEEAKDVVNSPKHYGQGNIECIEYIEGSLTDDEYIGFLRGNIIKYQHRWRYKNGLEDLKKLQWYVNKLVEKVEKT